MSKFFIVSTITYLAMSFGICYALIRTLPLGVWVRRSLYVLTFAFAFMSVSYLPLRRAAMLKGYIQDFFALSLGVVFVFFIAALLSDWIVRITRKTIKSDRYAVRIRGGAVLIGVVYLVYGVISAASAPNINEITIETDKISKPISIAHLTDLHLGNGAALGVDFAARIAQQTSDLNVDMVVITGDLIDAPMRVVRDPLKEIAKIKTKYGIFFVSGNHENMADAIVAMDYLDTLGIKTLRNSSAKISGDFGEIDIAGTLDLSGKRLGVLIPDPKAALSATDENNFILALAHQPNSIYLFPQNSFDLMLCGHTHGGQIFPFTLLVRFAQKYISGLYNHDDRGQIYVSRGVGYWGPPLRMFAPNEIAVITLNPKEQK
ncbi:putative metallophosphoesterase [Campylobacterota bacterium]|nr:putative metallophosphoesterase [Campylobacterota bacterium]